MSQHEYFVRVQVSGATEDDTTIYDKVIKPAFADEGWLDYIDCEGVDRSLPKGFRCKSDAPNQVKQFTKQLEEAFTFFARLNKVRIGRSIQVVVVEAVRRDTRNLNEHEE